MERKFTDWLQEKLHTKGWSMRELARRADVSHSLVSNIISGKTSPSWDFCAAIAGPLDESIWSVAKIAGLAISRLDAGDITLAELTTVLEQLSPEQRQEVLNYALFLWQRGKEDR